MAQAGGLGIVHRFLTIAGAGGRGRPRSSAPRTIVIEEPYTVGAAEDTVESARAIMRRTDVGGLLVVDPSRKLVGIVTERDIQFQENMKRPCGRS